MSNPIQVALATTEGMDDLLTDGMKALRQMADALDARGEALIGLAEALELSGHQAQAAIAASIREEAEMLGELSATLRGLADANGTLRDGHRLLRRHLRELI